jgi:hypothetical protein
MKIHSGFLLRGIAAILMLLTFFLWLEPSKYWQVCRTSLPLYFLIGMRFLIYQQLILPLDSSKRKYGIVKGFFDKIVFPFFVLFISFTQVMLLFVWMPD